MKPTASELKLKAREVHFNRWTSSALATLIFILICELLSGFTSVLTFKSTTLSLIFSIFSQIVVSLLIVMLFSGYLYYLMNLGRGIPSPVKSMFAIFKMQPDRYIIFGIFITAANLALTIPNYVMMFTGNFVGKSFVVITVGWAVVKGILLYLVILNIGITPMIMLDNPQLTVIEALKTSLHLMKGNKFRLFRLHISFLGLIILGILSFMLGFIWIAPYIMEASVQFYFSLLPEEATI